MVWDVAEFNCNDGTDIQLYNKNGDANQEWIVREDRSLESVGCPGKVVTIDNADCSDGANVKLYHKHKLHEYNEGDQDWSVESVGEIQGYTKFYFKTLMKGCEKYVHKKGGG